MSIIKMLLPTGMQLMWLISVICFSSVAMADASINLLDIKTRSITDNKVQVMLEFSSTPPEPTEFSLSKPAKIIFDFAGVKNSLSRQISAQKVSLGSMTAYSLIDSGSTTRLIIDVSSVVPYQIDRDGNRLVITLDNDMKFSAPVTADNKYSISSIDFRRGENGEGRLIVDLAGESVPLDFRENGENLIAEFRGATISDSLLRRFDVSDFGTNVNKVTVTRERGSVIIQMDTKGDFDNVAYQVDKQFIVEVRPLTEESAARLKAKKFKYTGENISLNFQDIEVRAVLQIIADFTGINMVISDTVTGNITLRLDNIPWDQALDFIMATKGLSKREDSNVMLIAPSSEITDREQIGLEAQQQSDALSPLQSEYLQVNFAKAADIAAMIKSSTSSLLSERGQVSVDARTNTILIKDIASSISAVKDLVEHLDIPVRQVLIEAQIVETTDTVTDAFGLQMAGAATGNLGKTGFGIAPTMVNARKFANDFTAKSTSPLSGSSGTAGSTSTSSSSTSTTGGGGTSGSSTSSSSSGSTTLPPLFFDFSTPDANSMMGFSLSKLPGGTLLDLELQAAESEVKSKTLARPKLMTLDQQQASIETGEDIPFTTTAQAGATPTTTFKKAVLKLDVTPHITPNDKISMTLAVNNDNPGLPINGQVAINTTAMKTNVLVDNGETIVLGGIFKKLDSDYDKGVPLLRDIPVVGRLFGVSGHNVTRTEILIFVTPRIVKSLYSK